MERLTKIQMRRLQVVAAYRPTQQHPNAPFWKDSSTDKSLVRRGLIERADTTTTLGGTSGALTNASVTWFGCRLTDAGRAALSKANGESGDV